MSVTGKRVEKMGIGGRARTVAGTGPTDLPYGSRSNDPMLSCLLLGMRVMQRVHDLHGKHHISVCGLFMETDRSCCFRCTLSIFDRRSFSFSFSGRGGTQVQDRNPPVLWFSEQQTMLWVGG